MKKILSVLLAAMLMLSLVGCSSGGDDALAGYEVPDSMDTFIDSCSEPTYEEVLKAAEAGEEKDIIMIGDVIQAETNGDEGYVWVATEGDMGVYAGGGVYLRYKEPNVYIENPPAAGDKIVFYGTLKGLENVAGEGEEENNAPMAYVYGITVKSSKPTNIASFKKSCKTAKFNSIARNSEKYEYKKLKMTGKIMQKTVGDGYTTLLVHTKKDYGMYLDDTVYVTYANDDKNIPKLLEDDVITFYGIYQGMYNYTTVMGASNNIPTFVAYSITMK